MADKIKIALAVALVIAGIAGYYHWDQSPLIARVGAVIVGTVIGASDAGAHLDMIDTFAFSTQVLEHGVRKRGLIGLEQAIHQLTAVPAALIVSSACSREPAGR